MPQMTHKELGAAIAVHDIEEQARQKWESKQRRRRNLNQWMVRSLPLGMLIMLVVFYSLSAPHTAAMLERITPGFGKFAPIGFELGILIIAALQEAGWRTNGTRRVLLTLIGISIAINIGGGLESVVKTAEMSGLSEMTIQELLVQLPVLVSGAQVSLILVFPLGVIIPVMTKFAGEILIKLSLNKITLVTVNDEDVWLKERRKVLQQALYAEAVKLGAGAVTAGNWSQAMVAQWYRAPVETIEYNPHNSADAIGSNQLSQPLETSNARAEMGFGGIADSRHTGFTKISGQLSSGNEANEIANVRVPDAVPMSQRNRHAADTVREYLRANPDAINAKVRDLEQLLGVSKSVVSRVQNEFRKQQDNE